ncbi:MAG: hypothetical protein IJY80_02245 [Opitutales bacterium]|nr:hypothetical protein [Opitutales bacterium]MBQ9759553.1 hypothetical protein [Opitutales bacterium]
MQILDTKILSRKELAAKIGRSPGFVSAMRKAGFSRIVSTPEEALEWLKNNPKFRKKLSREHLGTQ